MATEVAIGGDGALFVGEDKVIILEVVDSASAPVNTSGWTTVTFAVAKTDKGTPIFSKSSSRTGAFNASRVLNTERWSVSLSDDDLNLLKAQTYRYGWKRDDAGFETVLAYGDFVAEKQPVP